MVHSAFVIVGGNAAGMSAASRIRRNDPDAEIIVLEKSDVVSYGACGLPYFISGDIPDDKNLIARTVDHFREKNGIDVRLRQQVLSFDPRSKTVLVHNGQTGKKESIAYRKLLIATGAQPIVPDFPGKDLDNVFVLRTMEDGRRIKQAVASGQLKEAIIVGGGYIGLEMAEALRKGGMNVTIVEMLDRLMKNVDPEISHLIEKELVEQGCTIVKKNGIHSLSGDQAVRTVRLQNGESLLADLAVICVGVKPETAFARTGGVPLGKTGAIAVNPRMQTELTNVYAAGDCTEVKNIVTNKFEYIPLGSTANKQGRIAGDNMSGRVEKYKGVAATAAVKIFDLEVARTGITAWEAERLKLSFDEILITAGSRAHYYPGHQPLTVKLIFDARTGRLLGGQMIGKEGAAKRIDVLATALMQKMTVFDISELDLSYAPPFAPVWDPILIAAQQAQKKVKRIRP